MNVMPVKRIDSSVEDSLSTAPLFDALWRRAWIVAATTVACLVIGAVYLVSVTPIYESTAQLLIQQNAPKVYADNSIVVPQSDAYLYTQTGTILSTSVLSRALNAFPPRSLKSLAKISGDPAVWLRESGAIKAEVGKKDDMVYITMQSPYPQEAAAIVNSVVESYLFKQSNDKQTSGEGILKILRGEMDSLENRARECQRTMLQYQAETGNLSFRDDRGNLQLDRMASLSTSRTAAELATYDLRAQFDAAKLILASPASISAFVEAEETRGGQQFGDKEFDDLRSELQRLNLDLTGNLSVQGTGNSRVRVIQAQAALIKSKLAQKELSIAQAHFQDVAMQLKAAEEKEQSLRTALEEEQKRATLQNPKAAEYARLAAELDRIQKQKDVLSSRIEQVSLENKNAGGLSIDVIEPAIAEDHPIRPRKSMIMAAALLIGLLLGAGLAVAQEWTDTRLRKPEEIMTVLDVPVVGMIPRMQNTLSLADRGQIVERDDLHDVSEAFRSLRTTVHYGAARDGKMILVTSPMPGDGKSTTASNLAIALAQGGHRTLLIDCDLREPAQQRIFETSARAGLSTVMDRKEKLRDVIQTTAVENLFLLPCGPVPVKPAELLAGKRFAEVMRALGGSFDRIVIDSPPVIPFSDARILAASADVTLLVLRMNQSMREMSMMAIDSLQKVGANVLGAIANDVPATGENGYYARWKRYGQNRRVRLAALSGSPRKAVASRDVRSEALGLPASVPAIDEPEWVAQTP